MSKYYLWNMNKNERAGIQSITTGSLSFTAGTNQSNAYKENYVTTMSPSGERIFRYTRHGGGTQYTGSYFAIHQSQSSIPGGFHFGAGKNSDSVVFSSFFTSGRTDQYSDANINAKFISENEVAIVFGDISQNYQLMDNHTLSGSGFETSGVTGSGAGYAKVGLFLILSNSAGTAGTDWEVSFWQTGSNEGYYTQVPSGAAGRMDYMDYIVPNHRYTSTETDLIFIANTGRSGGSTSNRRNRGTVFKKTSGSWGVHANLYWNGSAHNASSTPSAVVHEANWLGQDQDLLGIS